MRPCTPLTRHAVPCHGRYLHTSISHNPKLYVRRGWGHLKSKDEFEDKTIDNYRLKIPDVNQISFQVVVPYE